MTEPNPTGDRWTLEYAERDGEWAWRVFSTRYFPPPGETRKVEVVAALDVRSEGEERRGPTEKDIAFLSESARLQGWVEGWQCARLDVDGNPPPIQEIREALTLAGFPDEYIAAALNQESSA
jgi:hypothetical protein